MRNTTATKMCVSSCRSHMINLRQIFAEKTLDVQRDDHNDLEQSVIFDTTLRGK